MRSLLFAAICLTAGCATSVQRLDGEIQTPAGPAATPCEQERWLVIAPTRTEYAEPGEKLTHKRDDGVGLYKVGGAFPEDITDTAPELGPSPMLVRHENAIHEYNKKKVTATVLGTIGLIAIGVGTGLFVSAFETSGPPGKETHTVNSGRAAIGGVTVALGFGLGIGGIVASPKQAERARADSWRYTFLPPDDSREDVTKLIGAHNRWVRQSCGGSAEDGASAAPPAAAPDAPADQPLAPGSFQPDAP